MIYALSGRWPVCRLCASMGVSKSGFYAWKTRVENPSPKELQRLENIQLFITYHEAYPSHGYRWLNAKIRLDTGLCFSDNYAHHCCNFAGIRSKAKHYRYRRPRDQSRVFPNLLLSKIAPERPFQTVVSDMTAFWVGRNHYELTLYMDLFKNEIVSYGLSDIRGNRNTYFEGLKDLINKKEEYGNLKLILHTDQGSVYSSKAFNDLLPLYNITHSMSRAGTPTDNPAMEAVNGWIKEELFTDFNIRDCDNVDEFIDNYIRYFNEERPAYSLKYLTHKQYKDKYFK